MSYCKGGEKRSGKGGQEKIMGSGGKEATRTGVKRKESQGEKARTADKDSEEGVVKKEASPTFSCSTSSVARASIVRFGSARV